MKLSLDSPEKCYTRYMQSTPMVWYSAKAEMVTPYCILSYPRSGSHYLQNLLLSNLGLHLTRYHDIDGIRIKDKYIISIVRHPLDAIVSDITKKIQNGLFTIADTDMYVQKSVEYFVLKMKQIEDNADIIIDFNELVNNPNSICNKISNILGLRVFNNDQDISVVSEDDGPKDRFIPSSKNLDLYNSIYDYVSKLDMSSAIAAYERILLRAI